MGDHDAVHRKTGEILRGHCRDPARALRRDRLSREEVAWFPLVTAVAKHLTKIAQERKCLFRLQFEGTRSITAREPRPQEHQAAGHIVSMFGKQRDMTTTGHLNFLFLPSPGPSPQNGAGHT